MLAPSSTSFTRLLISLVNSRSSDGFAPSASFARASSSSSSCCCCALASLSCSNSELRRRFSLARRPTAECGSGGALRVLGTRRVSDTFTRRVFVLKQGREHKLSTALYVVVFGTLFMFVNSTMYYAICESFDERCALPTAHSSRSPNQIGCATQTRSPPR